MKKTTFLVAATAFISLFVASAAFAQVAAPSPTGSTCPALTRTLGYGTRGSDVYALQTFLIGQAMLAPGNNTGFFGFNTQSAVQNWQRTYSIVSNGSPVSTGYGLVGRLTRAALAQVCSNPTPVTPTPVTPTPVTITDCAPGYVHDGTNNCVPKPKDCPPGYVRTPGASITNGDTQCVLDVVPVTIIDCAPGYVHDGTNKCVPITTPADPLDALRHLPLVGDTMDQYYTLGVKKAGLFVQTAHPTATWPWNNAPTSTEVDYEEWEVKNNCAAGKSFLWLNAFRNDYPATGVSYRFPITTTRAEISINGGPWLDITAGGACGTNGQPYALADVINEPYSIRVWGKIFPVAGDPTPPRTFFWQDTMTYMQNQTGACWAADSNNVRNVVKQEEAWWDSSFGWNPGSGSIGANGIADGVTVNYGNWQMIAKGAGDDWNASINGVSACLKYGWSW
jgi:hypothetical protein